MLRDTESGSSWLAYKLLTSYTPAYVQTFSKPFLKYYLHSKISGAIQIEKYDSLSSFSRRDFHYTAFLI